MWGLKNVWLFYMIVFYSDIAVASEQCSTAAEPRTNEAGHEMRIFRKDKHCIVKHLQFLWVCV
jgi:hypothetical protein